MSVDYTKFYNLEGYIFMEVGPCFVKTGKIDPADFYMILIWKANRAKGKVRQRLTKQAGSFTTAVEQIAFSLQNSTDARHRLEILMTEWSFRLPTATAILTVLYPTLFSIYDIRVCEQLGDFKQLADRKFSDGLWVDYQRFLKTIGEKAPATLSLRDKDRYLWGKSFYEDVQRDLTGEISSNHSPEGV